MTPVSQYIDELIAEQERRHAWLLRAAPIARELNKQAKRDVNNGD